MPLLFLILGVGGTTDTANTGRKFFGEKRDQFLELVDVSSAQFSVTSSVLSIL